MRGIIEEKASRIVEVLLGSMSPTELMTGKILGLGAVGLLQMGTYVVMATGLRLRFASVFDDPALQGVTASLEPAKLVWFTVFFLLGYVLYTSLFAAVGSMCSNEQDAQSLQTPLVFLLVIPLLCTFFFVNHPDSPAAVLASLFPFFSPMVMYMRIAVLPPPLWHVVLSVALLVVTNILLFLVVGRIFRVGILMTGKPPSLPEIWRWLRVS